MTDNNNLSPIEKITKENKCGKLLLRVRENHGKTQQQMADAIGIKRYNLAKYEVGINEPPGSVIYAVFEQFLVLDL
jgi:transcriptional regulator with XRE-family HTH domain